MTKKSVVGVLVLLVAIVAFMFASLSAVQPVSVEAQQPTSTPKPIAVAQSDDIVMNTAGGYAPGDAWQEVGATGRYTTLGSCTPNFAPWKVLGTSSGTAFYQDFDLTDANDDPAGHPFAFYVTGGNAGSSFYQGVFKMKLSWYDNYGTLYAYNERTGLSWSGGTSGCNGTQEWSLTGTVPTPASGRTIDHVRIIMSHTAADGKQVPFTTAVLNINW